MIAPRRRLLFSGGGAFTPADVPSTLLWLDFSDASTITVTGAGASSVANKKGTAGAATQGTDALRPTVVAGAINGLSVLRFSSQYLNGTISVAGTAFSFFWAGSMAAASVSAGRAFGTASSAGGDTTSTAGAAWLARSTNTEAVRGIHNSNAFTAHAITYDTPFVWANIKNPASFDTYVNNGAATNTALTATLASVRYAIGTNAATSNTYGTTYFNGDVGEVLFVGRAVSPAERIRIFTYLMTKWGIT